MNHYLMKFVGIYRVLPELDLETHDIPRNANGTIDEDWDDIYIACYHGGKISVYGHDTNGRVLLTAYIPSLKRGHLIIKALDEKRIEYNNYEETDEEILFRFKSKDIHVVAELMKAKTMGASISPFSVKNLPKSNVEMPLEKIQEYKSVIADIQNDDALYIHHTTERFLADILEKRLRKSDKSFSYKIDMKKKCMARQTKEYIYTSGFWDEYLAYLKKEINRYYKNLTNK